mgnify:CR=1 FL=1
MNKILQFKNIISILILITFSLTLNSCGIYRKTDARKIPTNANDRIVKNIKEGRGFKIGNVGNRGSGNFQFASSNPLWRASLETLDFLPMTTVDYSGGMIISDWYADNNKDESIKISIRFLSNEVRSDSLKVIVHKRTCSTNQNCKVSLLNSSKISQELLSTIIRKAALIEKESKKKK